MDGWVDGWIKQLSNKQSSWKATVSTIRVRQGSESMMETKNSSFFTQEHQKQCAYIYYQHFLNNTSVFEGLTTGDIHLLSLQRFYFEKKFMLTLWYRSSIPNWQAPSRSKKGHRAGLRLCTCVGSTVPGKGIQNLLGEWIYGSIKSSILEFQGRCYLVSPAHFTLNVCLIRSKGSVITSQHSQTHTHQKVVRWSLFSVRSGQSWSSHLPVSNRS